MKLLLVILVIVAALAWFGRGVFNEAVDTARQKEDRRLSPSGLERSALLAEADGEASARVLFRSGPSQTYVAKTYGLAPGACKAVKGPTRELHVCRDKVQTALRVSLAG